MQQHPDRFRVTGISAGGGNLGLLAAAGRRPAGRDRRGRGGGAGRTSSPPLGQAAREAGVHGFAPEVLVGPEANTRLAGSGADVVLNGITGSIGLRPPSPRWTPGSTLALANKESLIVGGAAGQGRRGRPGRSCRWTASTAPSPSACAAAPPRRYAGSWSPPAGARSAAGAGRELARRHRQRGPGPPHFAMGPVITTNSATLVNKGLEVIEAHLLFDIPFERIDVVVHPQSMVHSMVEFVDGSTIAQASPPDMLHARSRSASAGRTGCPAPRPACDWTDRLDLGRSCRWTTRRSPRSASPGACGQEGGDLPGGVQRRQRGVRRGVPGRQHPVPRRSSTRSRGWSTSGPTADGPETIRGADR